MRRRTHVIFQDAANFESESETANIDDTRHMTEAAEEVEESEWDCVK